MGANPLVDLVVKRVNFSASLGSFYDEDGKMSKSESLGGPWLLEDSNVTFNSLSNCFANAFNHECYSSPDWPVPQFCINGKKTLGENIADYLGMKVR